MEIMKEAQHLKEDDDGRQPGRPKKHADAWSKVSVILFDRQTLLLDQLASEIRAVNQREGKRVILRRAELIRAFVDAVLESTVDLTHATSEDDVKAIILEIMKSEPDSNERRVNPKNRRSRSTPMLKKVRMVRHHCRRRAARKKERTSPLETVIVSSPEMVPDRVDDMGEAEVPPPVQESVERKKEMDPILKAALESAHNVYMSQLKMFPENRESAEKLATMEATNYYRGESGINPKPKASALLVRWRKIGWWPPKKSFPKQRDGFFKTLKVRLETGRVWDFTDSHKKAKKK